ncbi:hypothetical protein IG626_10900 [Desulfovibrio desulfuricans]|uniref:hypothetical protein n=1 Tax=Desulfovibrio desulfuricans TaxID=876 RepID=UPI001783F5D9|nr:hypothetical protein [Desulfovibrio desulfuricans]MBD8896508.1 hypothetical protein [Desulfovibrio desulfuricans]
MDIQPSLLGYIPIAKDWLTLIIAGCGVWVAWQGLRTWRRQLKGTSQFDVAKRLMLKVYQIRRDIEYCRSPVRYVPWITHGAEDKPIPVNEQQYESTKKDMWERFDKIVKTSNEIELLLFEAEIVLDKKVREHFRPISEICFQLRTSIKFFLTYSDPKRKNRSDTDAESRKYNELEETIYAQDGDAIQTKVDSAVREIEKFIKPYVHG